MTCSLAVAAADDDFAVADVAVVKRTDAQRRTWTAVACTGTGVTTSKRRLSWCRIPGRVIPAVEDSSSTFGGFHQSRRT